MIRGLKNYFKKMTLKRGTNTVFLTLSIFLSVYFLWFNSKLLFPRIITTMCAVFFELGMKYDLALARTELKAGFMLGWRGWHRVLGALLLLIFYGGYMCYNIATMAGFFISEISIQDQIAIQAESSENQKMIELKELNDAIGILTKALDVEVETSYRSKSAELEAKIEAKKAERGILLNSMVLTKTDEVIEKNPSRAVAEALGIPLGTMLAWIYGFFAAGICLIMIITSEDLPSEKIEINADVYNNETNLLPEINDDKNALITYVDAAIRETGKLNGNPRIMELTGIPLDQCIKFRDWLTKLKVDGVPAVTITQGGGDVNIPKHRLLKVIEGV
jgi:hypothetical protein